MKKINNTEPVLYSDIHRLPLDRFINVTCDGDLSCLVISGTPTEDQLQAAWSKIAEDYNFAMADGTPYGLRIAELYKTIATETKKLRTVELFAPVLRDYHTPQFAKQLNKALSTSFKFDPRNRAEYDKTLQRCIDRAKGLKIRIAFATAKLGKLIEEHHGQKSENVKPSRQYFAAVMVNLSDFAGYALKEHEMTVGQFIERLKRYNAAASKAAAPERTKNRK